LVTTDKNAAVNEFDIVVRVGEFPTQGKKLVIQKGSTIISVPAEDVFNLVGAINELANYSYAPIATLEPIIRGDEDYCNTCPAR
jgi:hypothetical protein